MRSLESNDKAMEDKLLDLETLAEQLEAGGTAEGQDPCSFLEKWIPTNT